MSNHSDERLLQASEWVQRLGDADSSEQTFIEWQQWCDADVENRRAFEQMQEVWDGFAPARVARVISKPVRSWRQRMVLPLAAAAVLVAGVAIGFYFVAARELQLTTSVGETRHEILPDGSRMDLSADSEVVVNYSSERRELLLKRGQAFFVVARERARPFSVRAGGLNVIAVGTQFDVRIGAVNTVVTVGEGRVRIAPVASNSADPDATVEPMNLDAGQRVRYSNAARELTLAYVDPQLADSWRQGVLQFQEEPLQDVLSEVNRYLPRKISLADDTLGSAPFTGTIARERVEDWLIALEKILPVKVEDRGAEGLWITQRAAAAAVNE